MNLSKDTAQRMLQNIDKRLQALAAEQQAMNGNVGGKKMRKGGLIRKKMPDGDWVQPTGLPMSYMSPLTLPKQQPFFGSNTTGKPLLQYQIPTPSQGIKLKPYSYNFYGNGSVPKTNPVAISDTNLAKYQTNLDSLKYSATNEKLDIPYNETSLAASKNYNIKFSNPLDDPNSPLFNQAASKKQTFAGMMPPAKDKFNWNNLMGLAPTIFNTIAGLTAKGPDQLNPNEFQNPYESQAFSMMPDQFRVDDMLNDNRNSYATYLRNVNQTGNSRGERMANYGAGMNRMNEANTRAWALKNNQENAMLTNKAELRNNQGNVRAGINLKVRDMNDANSASFRNNRMAYLGAAASGAQTYGLTQEQMGNQNESQNAYIKALLRLNPYMSQWLGMEDRA